MHQNKVPVVFRPSLGGSVLQDSDPRLKSLRQSWLSAFPAAPVKTDLDFEDWVENAIRLDAAMQLAPDRVAICHGSENRAVFLDGSEVPAGTEIVFLGGWLRGDDDAQSQGIFSRYPHHPSCRVVADGIHQYARSKTFLKHVGRHVVLCGVSDESPDVVRQDLFDCLAAMYQAGHREAFVKVNLPKYAIFRVKIESGNAAEIRSSVAANHIDLAWATVHLAGKDDMFLVQTAVEMRYEYRVIVAHHLPVAGAGCVEAMTPLDNKALWDPKMETYRNSDVVVSDQQLASRYKRFASEFAAQYWREFPLQGNYTLDLALIHDEIVVVELNPLQNYGLYAMDYKAVLEHQLNVVAS